MDFRYNLNKIVGYCVSNRNILIQLPLNVSFNALNTTSLMNELHDCNCRLTVSVQKWEGKRAVMLSK